LVDARQPIIAPLARLPAAFFLSLKEQLCPPFQRPGA